MAALAVADDHAHATHRAAQVASGGTGDAQERLQPRQRETPLTTIDRLIRALTEAQADPTEEAVTRCLGMARAVRVEAQEHIAALLAGQQHDGPQLVHVRCLDGILGGRHDKRD